MKRRFDPDVLEMMDRPQPLSAELERDLERIRQLNRWFGSYRLILSFVRRWIKSATADSSCGEPGARMRIVDLATGSGDIPRLIVDYARKIGAHVEIDALDQQPATLEIATKLSTSYPEICSGVGFAAGISPPRWRLSFDRADFSRTDDAL